MNSPTPIPFDNGFSQLPEEFFDRQNPTPVSQPGLIRINEPLAHFLGVDTQWLASEQGIATMAGNYVPEAADPVAAAYAGHQFGGWNPQLGDGRAVLLGEVQASDGLSYDIQLKGSGPTKWSRGGDGRSPVGPVLREYIVSEAMASLGVATTRSLAAVTSGDSVFRDSVLPGAILCRVARSHIRVGSFQYFAARQNNDAVRTLSQFVAKRHFPDTLDADNPIDAMLHQVIQAQAELVAHWQSLGFIHGVMNTDNCLLSGETVDYGPCAFMDTFNPAKVFSSIDQNGRYAYENQPAIAHWNLAQLAQCLVPLLDNDQERAIELAQAALDSFPGVYSTAYEKKLSAKFGFLDRREDDMAMGQQFLTLLAEHKIDFTLAFRLLSELIFENDDRNKRYAVAWQHIQLPAEFDAWKTAWLQRVTQEQDVSAVAEQMSKANPWVIARNHQVEHAIEKATNESDFGPFHQLCGVLESPFDVVPDNAAYAAAPEGNEVVSRTFCGT